MEAKVYNQSGKEVGEITLSESVFGLPWNADLVHQVVVSMRSNARTPVAHTKDRSEVSGGGKKPWAQKGTGRARHGSTRSPIWIGGGVTHGPRNEKNFAKKINKKMKTKALRIVLSEKMRRGEIIFVDNLDIADAKTKSAKNVLASLGAVAGFEDLAVKKKSALYITTPERNENTARGFRNFGNVAFSDTNSMNVLDVLKYRYLMIAEPARGIEIIGK